MAFWLYLLLFYTPTMVERAHDPLDGWLAAETALRDLDCESMTTEGARQRAPGEIPEPSARGDYLSRRAVVCRERLMPNGVRRAQDDAVLSGLRGTAKDMAGLVLDVPGERTWLVETFYPDSAVSQKISFAVKNALLDHNLRVTDRAPTLAAGDIEVIGQLSQQAAYPLACARYAAAGSLKPGDGLLAVVLRDSSETILHAGLCLDGQWRWLR